ncbi:uncharacterized protein LOC110719939 [Chenopodium quinoa]|uniref:uncharacterized protein LOC110719939 n=1 Tax=Chenopodium quinoa TaxID=63459 RepID=UPI000B76EC30|nr:uncharacterized protein LOC110719939 [Chenopodium quinoa]
MLFDGSSRKESAGAGIVIYSPSGVVTKMAITFSTQCTNNKAVFEALVISLRTLKDMGVTKVKVLGDLQWVIAQAFKNFIGRVVILFLEEKIFTRYGIPESITIDQETMFTGHEFNSYLKEFEIQKIHSTPYSAQANRQAEATNKVISKEIAKMVDENPKNWHVLLHCATWAYRTSKKDAIWTAPYQLVYGHEPVVPAKLSAKSTRVANKMRISQEDYQQSMSIELMGVDGERLQALAKIEA